MSCGIKESRTNTNNQNTEHPQLATATATQAPKNDEAAQIQTKPPKKGDIVATLHVKEFGDIKVRFFPNEAPKAVENFTTHAKNGYYNGLTFHRVINDFMIQGGDPVGDGSGGESIWGTPFEDEFVDNLVPIRGALCMANAGSNTNGSQFFIVQKTEAGDLSPYALNDTQTALFEKNGGTPWLTNAHTVFGQVYEGLDVLDAIAATKVGAEDKPVENVIIESITINEYK